MKTLKVYGYYNGEDITEDDVPRAVIEVSDDGTEILSIESAVPEQQEIDEEIFRDYKEAGLTAIEAVNQYAGSYGIVLTDGETSEDASSANEDGGTEVEENAETEDNDSNDEGVVSAAEDGAVPNATTNSVSRITSGATMALVDENGIVVSLFRADENGNFQIRLDGNWKPLADPRNIEGLTFVGVEENSLDLYDKHQQEGNLVPIKFYDISIEGPYWSETTVTDVTDEAPEEDEAVEEDEEAVTAALTLDGPRDLDNAISAALLNKDLRWFVERRVAALGLDTELPWQKG